MEGERWRKALGRSRGVHERVEMPTEAEGRKGQEEREVEVSRMCSFPCGLFAC